MMIPFSTWRVVSLLLFATVSLVGCTSPDAEQAREQETSTIRQLAPLVGGYIGSHRGQYPRTEEDFRKFIESTGNDPNKLLISNRDGKPIKIVTQAERSKIKGNLVAYEQEGKDGQRIVVDDLGVPNMMTDEEFRQIVPLE